MPFEEEFIAANLPFKYSESFFTVPGVSGSSLYKHFIINRLRGEV